MDLNSIGVIMSITIQVFVLSTSCVIIGSIMIVIAMYTAKDYTAVFAVYSVVTSF